MNYKSIIAVAALHWLLSLSGFLLVYGVAVGAQDAGSAAPVLATLEIPVRYLMLQPLAHWVLEAAAIRWWTTGGLLVLAVLCALNSAVVAALIAALARRIRSRGRSRVTD